MNEYLCILKTYDPAGQEYPRICRGYGETERDAVTALVAPIRLQEGWSIRSVDVYPWADAKVFSIALPPAWIVDRERTS